MYAGKRESADPLVSVVVPAFNAESTIAMTLQSVISQTYSNVEIVLVDDGSTDGTADIVARLRSRNVPIRYEYQPNRGVAAARNLGIAVARGEFIATLDADDLWHPAKLQRQVERMIEAGSDTAMVYSWCSWVDENGKTIAYAPPKAVEGAILPYLCLGDIVLSCSNGLFRTDALRAIGGFDETLRARGAQGCEDWKLYMEIGARHRIAVVRDYLVRYRRSSRSMSENYLQMMRSHRLVEVEFRSRFPQYDRQLLAGRIKLSRSLAMRAARRRQLGATLKLMAGYPDPSLCFLVQSTAAALRLLPKWLRTRRKPRVTTPPAGGGPADGQARKMSEAHGA